ncbi:RDD family protein [compost metagenome]
MVLSPLIIVPLSILFATEGEDPGVAEAIFIVFSLLLPFLTLIPYTLAVWLYFVLMESSKVQGTVGKMALGIVVVDEEMNQLSFGQASVRFWSRLITGVTLGVGYIMAGFTQHKQTIHDMIARTYVVNKNVLEYAKKMQQMEATQAGEPNMALSPQPTYPDPGSFR